MQQYRELLTDAGLVGPGGGASLLSGAGAQGALLRARRARGALRGAALHSAKRKLREMQAERERERGRKVLRMDGSSGGAAGGSDDDGGSSDDEGVHACVGRRPRCEPQHTQSTHAPTAIALTPT